MIRTSRPEDLQLKMRDELMQWTPTNSDYYQVEVVDPRTVVQQLLQNDSNLMDAIEQISKQHQVDLDQQMELSQMNRLFAEAILLQCNHALSQAYVHIDRLVEQSKAKSLLLKKAEQDMMVWMRSCQHEFETLGQRLLVDELSAPPSPGPLMDWEPAILPMSLDYPLYLQEQVKANKLHVFQYGKEDSINEPSTPQAVRAVHPTDFVLPSESSYKETPEPTAPRTRKPSRTTPPAVDPRAPTLEQAIGREVQQRVEKKLDEKFSKLKNDLIEALRNQLAAVTATTASTTTPINQPPPPPPEQRRAPSPPQEREDSGPGESSRMGGGGGGRGGRTGGGPPGGDSSSSDSSSSSEEDSEPNAAINQKAWKRWYKRKEALRKARKGKKKASLSEDSEVEPRRRRHHGRMEKVEAFSGEDSAYDVEDLLWNLESKFEIEAEAWNGNDRAKVRYASSCLTGKALTWFRSYRYQVNPTEASRVGVDPTTLDPKYWTWSFFASQLRRSFGNKNQQEKALKQWDELKHTGSIDEFCDELERLMWMVNFNQPAIEHKIKSSLKHELKKDWAKVQNKPELLRDQLSMLREMGRPIERFEKEARRPDKPSAPSNNGGKRKREEESSTSQSKKPRSEKRPFGRFSSKEEALKGISKEVRDQRMKDRVCWRCGKEGHRAGDCKASAPVTAMVAASKKERKKEGKVSASSGKDEDKSLVVAGSSSRIVEMSSDDDMMED